MPGRRYLAALLILLGGCAAGGPRQNEDGTWSIQCAGGYHDWSRCLATADDLCGPDGFDIVSRVSDEGSAGVGTRDWSTEGSEVQRTMVVRCRP
jgi:hypothetical protein